MPDEGEAYPPERDKYRVSAEFTTYGKEFPYCEYLVLNLDQGLVTTAFGSVQKNEQVKALTDAGFTVLVFTKSELHEVKTVVETVRYGEGKPENPERDPGPKDYCDGPGRCLGSSECNH